MNKILIKRLFKFLRWLLGVLFFLNFLTQVHASQAVSCKRIIKKIDAGALIVKSLTSGELICSFNAKKNLKPASLVKILSAHILLNSLGEDYRFKTNFWVDDDDNLIIEGLGDAFIVSEEINQIAQNLKISQDNFNQLLVDYGKFDNITMPGVTKTTDPYNALNSALMVNFNTVYLSMSQNGVIYSAEKQSPLTQSALLYGKKNLKPNQTQRLSLGSDLALTLKYAAELFLAIFSENNITISQNTPKLVKNFEANKKLVYTHQNSVNLKQALTKSLEFSNNLQINQMMLILAAQKLGYPASYDKMYKTMSQQIKKLFPQSYKKTNIVEASGISHDNSLSAEFLIGLLDVFSPHMDMLPKKNGVYVKSGTLENVYNYAGYLVSGLEVRSFVILLNQSENRRDEVLEMLKKLP